MTTYLFTGQGSQFKGMGNELFAKFPELITKADDILGYSIQTLCLGDPQKHLQQTCYTQPALYIVNALTYFKKRQEIEKNPSFVAGHSLGEYNALLAAEVFDFETGLKLVKKRGELMNQAIDGSMAAILGLKLDEIKMILEKNQFARIAVANHNSHTQIVISGPKTDIEQSQSIFEQANAVFIPLQVSGAFHSPYMRFAQEHFEDFLKEFQFVPPKIPVLSNYTAIPYTYKDISNNLAQQITHTVRWTETIEYLRTNGEKEFEEIGPGTVLSGLMQRIRNGQ